ncbi:2-dehydropantoate 2-reductase [Rhodopseudomonas palustris]|uniref:2-dehydropantoate 2-reductase n=1 Tax=Rhodopseudomonas palustris TaxID=1076 RepID=UPI000E5AE414|nr:2-dehydropantoate 2-reductase [Rhodopseudomonas palustris]QLH69250.1 2-dehydropantoate 2-reductase [Rhodopseudomonas palustris]RHZ99192.1 2-dehydropantoate 2-reductase [Rhodopseudomonas palustris]
MRILIVGAGAIGGYFGGRLLQLGRDVTFLVRPGRAAELTRDGLVIKSPHGDATIHNPPAVQASALTPDYDLVVLSCKAFDLDDAIASFRGGVSPRTAILPLLNGMKHLDVLDTAFGRDRVLGGQCVIAATLDAQRHVVQLAPMSAITFGERDGALSERVAQIAVALGGSDFGVNASPVIMQEMWEKWVFLATLAGSTSLMRGAVGEILAAPGGADFMLGVLDEITSIAAAAGHPPRPAAVERTRSMLLAEGSMLTASMFRDILAGARIEADHVVGDLIDRADEAKVPVPRLRVIYTHLKTYERRRG